MLNGFTTQTMTMNLSVLICLLTPPCWRWTSTKEQQIRNLRQISTKRFHENTTEVKFVGTMIFSLLITSAKTHPRANWILLPTKHYWYIFSWWWIFMLMMIDSIMKTSQSYHHPQFTDAWIWPRGFPLEQLHQEESFHCCRFLELFTIFLRKTENVRIGISQ